MESMQKTFSLSKAMENDEKKFYRKNSDIPKEYWAYRWVKVSDGDKFYDPEFSTQNKIISEKTIFNRTKARDFAIDYVKNLDQNISSGKSIVFMGGKDSGKTVLATLILREIINKTLGDVLFVPFSQLIVESNVYLQDDIKNFTEKYTSPLALCIDDIDVRNTSEKLKEYLDHILTFRRLNLLPTIITSVGDFKDIRKTCGDPVYRLLSDNKIYKIFSIASFDEQNYGIDYFHTGHKVDIDLLISELRKIKISKGKENKISMEELQSVLCRAIHGQS